MFWIEDPGSTGTIQWHTGEEFTPPSGRVIKFQADGEELRWLLAKMRETVTGNAAALFATNLTRPKSTTTPADPHPDPLYELFREVRRWKELEWITAESYAYFLDRWALLCVQLRAGQ